MSHESFHTTKYKSKTPISYVYYKKIPIKKIKVNRDGKHPPEGYEMTIIPPSNITPYTRDA